MISRQPRMKHRRSRRDEPLTACHEPATAQDRRPRRIPRKSSKERMRIPSGRSQEPRGRAGEVIGRSSTPGPTTPTAACPGPEPWEWTTFNRIFWSFRSGIGFVT